MVVACYPGTFSRRLDIPAFIEGLSRVDEPTRKQFRMVICGKGDLEDHIRSRTASMLLTALVGAGVLAGDYLARVAYGAVLVTNISTARISLVAVAAVMFLILRGRYLTIAFVLLFVCSFATFSNSLKMGILAAGLLLILSFGLIVYQRKFLHSFLAVVLVLAGAVAVKLMGGTEQLANRMAPSPSIRAGCSANRAPASGR